jgi:hypothetical protein
MNALEYRFHETNQIGRIELDPADLILRSRAQCGVSKDGRRHGLARGPSFETPTFGRLLIRK